MKILTARGKGAPRLVLKWYFFVKRYILYAQNLECWLPLAPTSLKPKGDWEARKKELHSDLWFSGRLPCLCIMGPHGGSTWISSGHHSTIVWRGFEVILGSAPIMPREYLGQWPLFFPVWLRMITDKNRFIDP